uniref:Putative ovule protein n=1 Tax=Solanum chacoense TaxID=4108 RepID=A0A0V0GYQ2_SOLCH
MQTSQSLTRRLLAFSKTRRLLVFNKLHQNLWCITPIPTEGLEVQASYRTPKYFFHASLFQ